MKDKIKKILEEYKVYGAKQDLITEELLVLFNVSQQRELLLDYEIYNAAEYDKKKNMKYLENLVDNYLANNCG